MSLISDAINPYRIYAEIAGGVAIIGLIGYLWTHHNATVSAIATAKCEQGVQAAAAPALAQTNETNLANASMLQQVVGSYDQKIAALNFDRDNLAQRVHDSEAARLRASAVPSVSQPAGFVCTAADDGRPTERDRREADNLSACAANTIELIKIREAWQKLAGQPIPK